MSLLNSSISILINIDHKDLYKINLLYKLLYKIYDLTEKFIKNRIP